MANFYKFSFRPMAPAWTEWEDQTYPARRLSQREMSVIAENEQFAREQLVADYADHEKGSTLEDVTLLSVWPWTS